MFLTKVPKRTTKSPEANPPTPTDGLVAVNPPVLDKNIAEPNGSAMVIFSNLPEVITDPVSASSTSSSNIPTKESISDSVATFTVCNSPKESILTGVALFKVPPELLSNESANAAALPAPPAD